MSSECGNRAPVSHAPTVEEATPASRARSDWNHPRRLRATAILFPIAARLSFTVSGALVFLPLFVLFILHLVFLKQPENQHVKVGVPPHVHRGLKLTYHLGGKQRDATGRTPYKQTGSSPQRSDEPPREQALIRFAIRL